MFQEYFDDTVSQFVKNRFLKYPIYVSKTILLLKQTRASEQWLTCTPDQYHLLMKANFLHKSLMQML